MIFEAISQNTHSAFETLTRRGGPDLADKLTKAQAAVNIERTIV